MSKATVKRVAPHRRPWRKFRAKVIDEVAERLEGHWKALKARPIPEAITVAERGLMVGTLMSATALVRGFKYGLPPDADFEAKGGGEGGAGRVGVVDREYWGELVGELCIAEHDLRKGRANQEQTAALCLKASDALCDAIAEEPTQVKASSGVKLGLGADSREALARAIYEAVWNDGKPERSVVWSGPGGASGPKWMEIAGAVLKALHGPQ